MILLKPKNSNDSELLTVINTGELETLRLRKLVKELHNGYGNVVEDDFKTFYFLSVEKNQSISVDWKFRVLIPIKQRMVR